MINHIVAYMGKVRKMKKILDACCGSRMFWFDKENPDALFADNREVRTTLCDGRELLIKPDINMDFRNMPFDDETFKIVVFDPPHLINAGSSSWLPMDIILIAIMIGLRLRHGNRFQNHIRRIKWDIVK